MMLSIKALSARDGDCFFIRYGNTESGVYTNILIDGGRGDKVVKQIKNEILRIQTEKESLDLLVLSHIDEDHIQGLLKLFSDDKFNKNCIKSILFNSRELLSKHYNDEMLEDSQLLIPKNKEEISFKQGQTLWKYIQTLNMSEETSLAHSACNAIELNGAVITIVSPNEEILTKLSDNWTREFRKNELDKEISAKRSDYKCGIEELLRNPFKEDCAIINGSSISFILEHEGKRILMLADSHPSLVRKKLEELYQGRETRFDFVKVSHHGSKANTSNDLLRLINCTNFLISVNKGNSHAFPHKEALSRIVNNNYNKGRSTNFYFNYSGIAENIFSEDELSKYKIICTEKKMDEEVLEIDLWKLSEN